MWCLSWRQSTIVFSKSGHSNASFRAIDPTRLESGKLQRPCSGQRCTESLHCTYCMCRQLLARQHHYQLSYWTSFGVELDLYRGEICFGTFETPVKQCSVRGWEPNALRVRIFPAWAVSVGCSSTVSRQRCAKLPARAGVTGPRSFRSFRRRRPARSSNRSRSACVSVCLAAAVHWRQECAWRAFSDILPWRPSGKNSKYSPSQLLLWLLSRKVFRVVVRCYVYTAKDTPNCPQKDSFSGPFGWWPKEQEKMTFPPKFKTSFGRKIRRFARFVRKKGLISWWS